MPIFARRAPLPPDVRARVDLAARDRVLAAAELTDGWAIATRLALYVVAAPRDVERRAWADVDRATLDPERSVITVDWVDGGRRELHVADENQNAFPRTLHERVQSSVVHSETVELPGGGRVRVALRRDEDGELFSQVIGDGLTDLGDPGVAARVDAAEARVRGAAGLPL
ncbi:hypothetical protein [Cellulomonas fimi]|uniref:Uncharacterized protein n=1 Tax=Cellulomonas fimi TaxID=1708 RepID=A0A7Y0LWL6_CELFI|nr:hypothetical protein [Cellulomonas fimi]NMR19174.1 hypothetical protein [Cellulomonas fimi]